MLETGVNAQICDFLYLPAANALSTRMGPLPIARFPAIRNKNSENGFCLPRPRGIEDELQ
jgi:hypothetical protein